ncbi:MAG: NADH-quinone oxidoreductase subunit K [Elusimicrobiota bacterium]
MNFPLDWFFVIILFFIGAYCMTVSRNIIKLLIGFEIISKSSLIAVITAGQATNNINLAQNIIIVMILVEVVVIASGLALVVKSYNLNQSVDIKKLMNLKG